VGGYEELSADDRAVGKVAHPAAQYSGDGKAAFGFDGFGELRGRHGAIAGAGGGASAEEGEAVGSLGVFPIGQGFAAEDLAQAGAGQCAPRDGLRVAAETVVFGVGDEAGANGVKVDIGGYGLDDFFVRLDEDGFEAFGPEGAVAIVGVVEPDGEALFEELHELGDVAHERELTFAPSLALGVGGVEPGLDDLESGLLEAGGFGVEDGVAAEEFGVGYGGGFGNLKEDVEVIGEDGVSEDSDAAEVGDLAELAAEGFLGGIVEEEGTVHGAGHDVVDRLSGGGGDFDASGAHGGGGEDGWG